MANSFALDTLRQAILSQTIRESHGPSTRRSSNAAPSVSSDNVQFGSSADLRPDVAVGSFSTELDWPRDVRFLCVAPANRFATDAEPTGDADKVSRPGLLSEGDQTYESTP